MGCLSAYERCECEEGASAESERRRRRPAVLDGEWQSTSIGPSRHSFLWVKWTANRLPTIFSMQLPVSARGPNRARLASAKRWRKHVGIRKKTSYNAPR